LDVKCPDKQGQGVIAITKEDLVFTGSRVLAVMSNELILVKKWISRATEQQLRNRDKDLFTINWDRRIIINVVDELLV
jgi:hypothetical protein